MEQQDTEAKRLRASEGAMEDIMLCLEQFYDGERDPFATLALISRTVGAYQMATGWPASGVPDDFGTLPEGVEMYGLVSQDDKHLHGGKSLRWIKARQAEHPGSLITVKRNGVWTDYEEDAHE